MDDKRRCHRLNLQLPVSFRKLDDQQHLSMGSTLDVSALGMRMSSKEELRKGQVLDLYIGLSSVEKIKIHTRVIWVEEKDIFGSKEYLVGLKIIDSMKFDEKKFIKYFSGKFLDYFKK